MVGEHDSALLAEVRPPDWTNPTPAERYDLVVIGGGTGGLVSAAIGAGLGARVALVERALMGGDCLNVGCVPSKALLRASRSWSEARSSAGQFGGPAVAGAGDFAAAMERMRRVRAGIAPVDGATRFRDMGVDVFFGDAAFTGRDRLAVGELTLRFRRAIVASGSRPRIPDVTGLREAAPLTNETVFSLTSLPDRLLVVGGGPIACELAQAFARFGARVTMVHDGAHLLPRDDADAGAIVQRGLETDGVEVHHRATLREVRCNRDDRTLVWTNGGAVEERTGDALLVAAGRAPNVESLALERAGVSLGEHGIAVDDRLRTSNPRVFAVGDCASPLQFTHAADAQARLAVPNALFHGIGGGRASRLVVPWCTYTSPEVAQVGLTAKQAAQRDSGASAQVITVPLAEVDRAQLDGAIDGFVRVVLARGSDRILGATIVAEHAGELIGLFAHAMRTRRGLGDLGATIAPYPTIALAVRRAADQWRRGKLTPFARRMLRAALRLLR